MVMLFVENVGRIGCLWAICRECGPICRECGSEVPPICTECEPNQGDICGPEGLHLWATTRTGLRQNGLNVSGKADCKGICPFFYPLAHQSQQDRVLIEEGVYTEYVSEPVTSNARVKWNA